VKDPEILVLDEPTVNIDPEGVREILGLVARLRDERGVTVLLSSHLLNQVQAVCDRVGIFVQGTLKAQGSVDQLLATVRDGWDIEVGAVGADVDRLAEALRAVPAVRTVAVTPDGFLVRADADVRALLPGAVAAAGGHLLHLQRQRADLDTIYHHYFGGDHDDLVGAGRDG
jgi:ABC-2 type transport system ATP-binding protein